MYLTTFPASATSRGTKITAPTANANGPYTVASGGTVTLWDREDDAGQRAAHRFDLEVLRFRGREALGFQVKGLEHVQHLDQGDAAGAGRRH